MFPMRQGEVIIFVVGQSGAGCSTFINTASGQSPGVAVGRPGSLASVTKVVTRVECTHPFRGGDIGVSLIDTPSFSCEPDSDQALKNLKHWISKHWTSDLDDVDAGILYLHRITDVRMSESPDVATKTFKKLFPRDPPQVSVLATTMWHESTRSREDVAKREYDIMHSFPATFGNIVPRFDGTQEAAWKAIDLVLDRLQMAKIRHQDSVVVLMGPTGSGKTTFVNTLLGRDTPNSEGQTLMSSTNEVKSSKCSLPGTPMTVVLVDTPGFDSSELTNTDVLTMMADYLNNLYRRDLKLAGMLYFHRITDNRFASHAVDNTHVFEGVCGQEGARNVTFVTTMWDDVDAELGAAHEDQLKTYYWKSMIKDGAQVERFHRNADSAWGILSGLLKKERIEAVLLQEEMVDLRMSLSETQAGVLLHDTLSKLVVAKQAELRALQAKLAGLEEADNEYLSTLGEMWRIQQDLDETLKQVKRMKISFTRRFLSHFRVVPHTRRRLQRKTSSPAISAPIDFQFLESD